MIFDKITRGSVAGDVQAEVQIGLCRTSIPGGATSQHRWRHWRGQRAWDNGGGAITRWAGHKAGRLATINIPSVSIHYAIHCAIHGGQNAEFWLECFSFCNQTWPLITKSFMIRAGPYIIYSMAMAIRRAALHISSVAMLIRRAALHISSVAMLIRRAALHTSSVAMLIRRAALHISSVKMAYLQSIRRTSTCKVIYLRGSGTDNILGGGHFAWGKQTWDVSVTLTRSYKFLTKL